MDINLNKESSKNLEKEEIEKKKEEKVENVQKEQKIEKVKKVKKKKEKAKRLPGLGLDCGTMFVVRATFDENKKISYKTERDSFIDIENNVMSKNMLDKLNATYIESNDKKKLYVVGEESLSLAGFFNRECRRPFASGVISTREKEALNIIKAIMYSLVGDPIIENEKLYFSSPANPIDSDFNNIYHENVLKSFLKSFGYNVEPIGEAYAITWAELEDKSYTGITLSFGAGQVNCALSKLGISEQNHQFSIAKSGDWIDQNSATALGVKSSKITAIKEGGVDLLNPKNREETAIKIYYENLITYVCNALEKKFNQNDINIDQPVTVIVSGGTSQAINFEKVFEEELKTKTFPFEIETVRKASNPLNSVAKGCLLMALED